MKKFVCMLALTLSVSAFAQQKVVLDSGDVQVNASEAILVRTSQTPNDVIVTFQVPMANSVCAQWGKRSVLRTSGAYCGYAQTVTGYRSVTTCTRRNPYSGACVNSRVDRVPVYSSVPRTCTVVEDFCASYGTSTNFESDEVKIKFKKASKLEEGQEETFLVKAKQKNYDGENVVYDIDVLTSLQEYEVKSRGLFGSDKYVIQPK